MQRSIILVLVVVLALSLAGCNNSDVFAYLGSASGYAGAVGQNMAARGWQDFPANIVDWYKYIADLRASIAQARDGTLIGVTPTGARVYEYNSRKEDDAAAEVDVGLGKAFKLKNKW